MKLTVIIPAYNEERVITKVLTDLKKVLQKFGEYEIVVIDDGSSDKTGALARKQGATVLRHLINRGLGGALGTGLAFTKRKNAQLVVTMDADGQHDPKDLKKVIKPIIQANADVVIGSRLLKGTSRIPLDRLAVLKASNLLTQLLYSIKTSDSQSGFRAFSKKAISEIKIITQEMEVSTELFSEIKRLKLRLSEVPIKVIYTPYSKGKGQSNLNAVSVVARLILRLAR